MGTSSRKVPLGRILCNFLLHMRTLKGTPRRSRDFWSLRVTFHNVTSSGKAPLGRILRKLWLHMRIHKETPKESRDLWSLPVAMVLVLLYYMLYYYYSKNKNAGNGCACAHNHFRSLPVRDSSSQGRFRSRDFR